MSKLSVDRKRIGDLFRDRESDFLIPDYQRPYEWNDEECQTLWDDIFAFAFPDDNYLNFDDNNDEYFLGPIVVFKNERNKLEVIDGQQRLTTLMLLLRAFYSRFENMQDQGSQSTRDDIAKCVWKTNIFGQPNFEELKINSEVASDDDKDEFIKILKDGKVPEEFKSQYAENFRFFEDKINKFINDFPMYCAYLPARIMNNCILLPIEAESQDFAFRIFSTLNDRGKPLSDSDIFKAQFYNFYAGLGEKDKFISRWKDLEEKCEKNFSPKQGTPLDDLFTHYMYYIRAAKGVRDTTTVALRAFYEKDGYRLMKETQTLDNLEKLADFWGDIKAFDGAAFSDRVLRKLYVLSYAPNGMWEYLASVYFMANKDEAGHLDEEEFYKFLDKITAFIFAYAFMHPGVSSLRGPVFPEMINIVNKQPVKFENFKFNKKAVLDGMKNYAFTNQRMITKSILTWLAFNDERQKLFNPGDKLEIEHIFPKNRQEIERSLKNSKSLESIGNKAILEKRVNIRAADYKFQDRKRYYLGFVTDRGVVKEGTKNQELLDMATQRKDFTEQDITARENKIFESFIEYLRINELLN